MFVTSPAAGRPSKPIGVLASLWVGFDRVASRPLLIVPPILLDLLLWLGPRVRITALTDELSASLVPAEGATEAMSQQLTLMQEMIASMGESFNLLSVLSSLPVGIPSLMAGRMPIGAPLRLGAPLQVFDPVAVILILLGVTVAGLVMGALYQLWLASTLAPEAPLSSAGNAAWRVILFATLLLVGLVIVGGPFTLATVLAISLLPLLGVGVMFVGFTLFFWSAVYLAFTPHGIVRYGFGVIRAMLESFTLVRWNTLGTVGYLGLAIGIYWLSNIVWALPDESTWFALLAILGHAFVSAMLLMGSYAFYQGRWEWLAAYKKALALGSAHRGDAGESGS